MKQADEAYTAYWREIQEGLAEIAQRLQALDDGLSGRQTLLGKESGHEAFTRPVRSNGETHR